MKTFRAFGPTIGKSKLSKKIINNLNKHIDKSHLSKKNDYGSKLASQIRNEIKISNSIINKIYSFWPLFILVLFGGQLGNFLNLKIFPTKMLVLVTSTLVIFVALRMGFKLFI